MAIKNLKQIGDFEEYFKKKITGKVYDQTFIYIGTPDDFYSAPKFIKKNFPKKAIFFDRDGVLNKIKSGKYIINKNQFKWTRGAKKIIKFLNDNNYFVFIISNQAGIGKGFIKIEDYLGI